MPSAHVPACFHLRKGGDLQPRALSPWEQEWSVAHFPPGLLRDVAATLSRGLHVFECRRTAAFLGATSFLAAFLSILALRRPILWISQDTTVREAGRMSAHGLVELGLNPDNVIFVEARRPQDVLWCLEQATVSKSIGAAVAEVTKTRQLLDMTATRRLSLRTQASDVAVHILAAGSVGPTAALTRWVVGTAPNVQHLQDHLGWPTWRLELNKNKSGSCGALELSFDSPGQRFVVPRHTRKFPTLDPTITGPHDIIDWSSARSRATAQGGN